MNGNTWRQYRFVTKLGSARPFFLEPRNPCEYPSHFRHLGFRTVATYVSEFNHSIATRQPELGSLRNKLTGEGIEFLPLDASGHGGDLDGVYDVVCESFANAFLYTPLDKVSFRKLYEPLLQQVDPRLMLLAKQAGKVVGFVFAPPDLLQRQYQGVVDSIVIKTLAVLPRRRLAGLGRVLVVEMMQNAIAMGYSTAVSALMHVDNRSRGISAGCARPMREYALLAKDLTR